MVFSTKRQNEIPLCCSPVVGALVPVGANEGDAVGVAVGASVGAAVPGFAVGDGDLGAAVGAFVVLVGARVGATVVTFVWFDGEIVAFDVGAIVAFDVGACVALPSFIMNALSRRRRRGGSTLSTTQAPRVLLPFKRTRQSPNHSRR